MTTYALDTGRRAWEGLQRARGRIEAVRPAAILGPALAVQGATTLLLALVVRHNGWLYYQGGDQLWYWVSARLLAHGELPMTFVGHGWPAILAPFAAFGGPTVVPALPAIVLFNVLVLGPVALLAMYGIGRQIGGRLFGYWVIALWLVVPFIGIKYTDHLYHQRYTELTLPQSFGLTALADFPSMVAVIVCIYFALRVMERPDTVDALAAGVAAGTVIAIKPANSVFLAGIALGLAYRRRVRGAALIVAGLAPAVLTLALWKYRGLGHLPLFQSDGLRVLAAGAHQQVAAFNPLRRYVNLDWHHLNLQLQAIREHFWSVRVIEWLVVAGLVGLARRSVTVFLVVGGWFAAFVVTKGTYVHSNIEDASLFRLMMPSYPAFVLLLAGLVFLVPGPRRAPLTVSGRPQRHLHERRLALLGAAAVVFALYPLALVAAASPARGPNPSSYLADGVPRSVDRSLVLNAATVGTRVRLTWRAPQPAGTAIFYRIWRSKAPNGGATCVPVSGGADDCELAMADIGARGGGHFVDTPGPGRWTYRLAVAANWLNSPLYGDVYSVGPPAVVRVH
jgi:hypothetical protein